MEQNPGPCKRDVTIQFGFTHSIHDLFKPNFNRQAGMQAELVNQLGLVRQADPCLALIKFQCVSIFNDLSHVHISGEKGK